MAGSTVKAIKKVIVSTGRRGLDGASAYQVWLSEGNQGTIEDFIAYIICIRYLIHRIYLCAGYLYKGRCYAKTA